MSRLNPAVAGFTHGVDLRYPTARIREVQPQLVNRVMKLNPPLEVTCAKLYARIVQI